MFGLCSPFLCGYGFLRAGSARWHHSPNAPSAQRSDTGSAFFTEQFRRTMACAGGVFLGLLDIFRSLPAEIGGKDGDVQNGLLHTLQLREREGLGEEVEDGFKLPRFLSEGGEGGGDDGSVVECQ